VIQNEEPLDSEISDSFDEEAFGSDDEEEEESLLNALAQGKDRSILEAVNAAGGKQGVQDECEEKEEGRRDPKDLSQNYSRKSCRPFCRARNI
jgi:hypothetical protein